MKITMKQAGAGLSIKGAFEDFVVSQMAKGVSDKTVETYRSHFKTSTESRREKTYEEVNAKNPCGCKALNGNWRKLEAPRKRAFFLEKSDSERKWRERAKNKQAFLPMTNSDDKRKRHEEKSCVLSKVVSGIS